MNYEELLGTRDARKTNKVRLPYGYFYKRLINGKYSNFVEFYDELSDNISFSDRVRRECEAVEAMTNPTQLHFTPNEGSGGVYAVAVEPGNYITFEQLINDSPSIVAKGDFIHTTIRDLVKLTSELNQQNIQHVCFAPSNVLVRKNDSSVRLLFHGSFYQKLGMEDEMYDGVESYVAPEAMDGMPVTDRCDVYSLAKFINYLYQSSGLPFELKKVIEKATAENPDDRYASVEAMYSAMKTRSRLRSTVLTGIAALVVALVGVGLFFDMLPNTEPVEFVKPVEEPVEEGLLDEGFDPLTELGPDADSAAIARAIQGYILNDSGRVDEKKLREFEAKAEQIFRKQYTAEADRILSKIYNNDEMNSNEANFMTNSQQVMEELVAKQRELSSRSALPDDKAQRIASEIIEQLTEKKKAQMAGKTNYGFQRGSQDAGNTNNDE